MNRGFTLVELIVVISVIAILAGIVTPAVGAVLDEAKKSRAIADVDTLAKASLMYCTNVKSYPYAGLPGGRSSYSYCNSLANLTTLNNLLMNPGTGYTQCLTARIPQNPWGQWYFYHNYSEHATIRNAQVVFGHYGPNNTNNGVWNWQGCWVPGTTAPADDYYIVHK